jgi:hypothetical protein
VGSCASARADVLSFDRNGRRSKVREQILPALALSLSGSCGNKWVPALELFEESDLWNGCCVVTLESQGAFAYMFEQNILIRHKFSSTCSTWFLLGCLASQTTT